MEACLLIQHDLKLRYNAERKLYLKTKERAEKQRVRDIKKQKLDAILNNR